MLNDFVAIDFETANQHLSSVCSVGVVLVRDGEVVDSYYSLIHPEPEYYSFWNRRIHGLSSRDTCNSPVFPTVWAEVERLIAATYEQPAAVPLVAHNARFDEGCLRFSEERILVLRSITNQGQVRELLDVGVTFTLGSYEAGIALNALAAERHTVAEACGFDLRNHHHALADAEACAAIALAIM